MPCVPQGCLEVWRYLRPEADLSHLDYLSFYDPTFGDIFSNHGMILGGQAFSDISSR